jgi:hypothetical protein
MTAAGAHGLRLGDVFGIATTVFARRPVLFVTLTLLAHIPLYLFELVFRSHVLNIGMALMLLLLRLLGSSIASGLVIGGVIQELRGRGPSDADWRELTSRRFPAMLGAAICTSSLTTLASILLVIPGFMLACAYYVTMPVCVAEQTGVLNSISRSAYLTQGSRWPIFGAVLLLTIASFVIGAVAGSVTGPTGMAGIAIVATGTTAIVSSFSAILVGVIYCQLRASKEGTDFDRLASVFD